MTDRERVESYIPLVKFIAEICGPHCEVALHYLENVDHSIIAIENGNITGRKVNDGLMDFILSETLFNKKNQDVSYITNYYGKIENPERNLRFSSLYIRGEDGKEIVGILNVSIDVTGWLMVKQRVDEEVGLAGIPGLLSPAEIHTDDHAAISASKMVNSLLKKAIRETGITDVMKMHKEDKIHIISLLDEKNLFSVKGTIKLVAKKLHISEPTVYRYLRDIRSEKDT